MKTNLVFAFTLAVALGSTSVSEAQAKPTAPKSSTVKSKKPTASSEKTMAPSKPGETSQVLESNAAQRNVNLIDYANRRLKSLRSTEVNCDECFASTTGDGLSTLDAKDPQKICTDKWNDFYSKDVVDIRFVFGYNDSDEETLVGDSIARQSMVDQVTAPCAPDNLVQACGFKRSADDADTFEKVVVGPAGNDHTIRLNLKSSSYSASDRINKEFLGEQKEKSDEAERTFYRGLREADMLLYIGHARDGGGPDFEAAKRRPNGTTDFDYYRSQAPGMDKLTRVLSEPGQTPKILGFLACDSERWSARLERLAPKSGLILSATPKVPLEAAATQAFLALDSVIWQRCEGAFDKSLNQLKKYDGREYVPMQLKRFYKAN